MNEQTMERLLALHYVYPQPYSRISRVLDKDPGLEFFHRLPVNYIAELLEMRFNKAAEFKTLYEQFLQRPFLQMYAHHRIIPIPIHHSMYPTSLYDLIDPPTVLYAKGQIDILPVSERIAIIGSRKASDYSRTAIAALVPPLTAKGYVIVSGLAKGADAMAHKAAIDAGGKTIAVLGSGFNHPYPKENAALHHIIVESQLAITEYPPYIKPRKWNFPMRNRIISGLSRGIAVTEAELKSGTLSTVEHALEHGKDVFAIPGPITSRLSDGPHRLLSEGAKLVWNGAQIVEEYEGIHPIKEVE